MKSNEYYKVKYLSTNYFQIINQILYNLYSLQIFHNFIKYLN